MKKYIIFTMFSLLLALSGSCQSGMNEANQKAATIAQNEQTPVKVAPVNGMETAYFASGCFWCVEAIYEDVIGVDEVINGYSGGHTKNPTYESSNTGTTGHAESVEVIYDPKAISFKELVDIYFGTQNITQVNGQEGDHGSQYRSIVFYQDDVQKKIIDDKVAMLEKEVGTGKVAAQVLPFQKFWVAEDYHQNYVRLHPNQPYVRAVSIPRKNRFEEKFSQFVK